MSRSRAGPSSVTAHHRGSPVGTVGAEASASFFLQTRKRHACIHHEVAWACYRNSDEQACAHTPNTCRCTSCGAPMSTSTWRPARSQLRWMHGRSTGVLMVVCATMPHTVLPAGLQDGMARVLTFWPSSLRHSSASFSCDVFKAPANLLRILALSSFCAWCHTVIIPCAAHIVHQ